MIEPYYKKNSDVKLNFVVSVSGQEYAFDCLERATEFIQQILMYSVQKPTLTLAIFICED